MCASPENKSFELLVDFQTGIRYALDSLGGKPSQGLMDNYRLYVAAHVNRAADGFIYLRKAARTDSSKLLIRPAIEAIIKLFAIRKKPELLYRIAYTETVSDRKWLKEVSSTAGEKFNENADMKRWEDFKASYKAQFSAHPLVEKELTLLDTAKEAGIAGYYHSHYRTYCKYTHATLRAVGGSLDELSDSEDSRTMAFCVFAALENLQDLGAKVSEPLSAARSARSARRVAVFGS